MHFALPFDPSDPVMNGEKHTWQKIGATFSEANAVIFDIGAHHGLFVESLRQLFPKTNITAYLFEANPNSAIALQNKFRQQEQIKILPFAVHSENGITDLHIPNKTPDHGSIFWREHFTKPNTSTVSIQTIALSSFLQSQNISQVDYLKIDTEGNENNVLRGLGNYLKDGTLKYIQFEYGGTFLDANETLKSTFELLSKYEIYRILPNSLKKVKFKNAHEDFKYANFLAKYAS